jgi:peptidoglycan/xylan/chitin deacetylase (PgdA/CDA1 family)
MTFNNLYYHIRPLVPRRLQIVLRRAVVRRKRRLYYDVWPVDPGAAALPQGWRGWPDGKRFAFVLTHDVETAEGRDKCLRLAEIEKDLGFRSSFNFVAEDYETPPALRAQLEAQGFEIAIHGLTHRANLFRSRRAFQESAQRINSYLKEWGSVGFRAPSMYHNLDWLEDVHVEYDASTFDTDPFEPQPDGVQTIFPFLVSGNKGNGCVELPYTLAQDFTLFVLMKERGDSLWRRKLDWIAAKGGMALLITHPDYMSFDDRKPGTGRYPASLYYDFLGYVRERYGDQYWNILPRDIARYWTGTHSGVGRKVSRSSLKVEIIDPLQDKRWDAFVENHPFGWICHLSGWKEVVESSFSHMRGHYLAVVNQAGQLKAGLPVFEVRSWLTGNRLVSIPFATLSDPLIGTEEETNMLFDAALELSHQTGIPRIEIRSLHSQNLLTDPRMGRECFFQHHYLELADDIGSLKMSFHHNCKRNIARGLKSSLTLCVADSEEQLRAYYALHVRTRGRLGLPPQPFRFFQALWNVFMPRGMMTLLLAEYGKEVVAGQLYFKFKGRASMEFEAWDRDKRNLAPNHFIIWEAIRLFQEEGYQKLDFGRTAISNVPLRVFKERWGTKVVNLPTFLYPANWNRAQGNREDSMSYKLIKHTCKVAPEWVLSSIGDFCYRHLG